MDYDFVWESIWLESKLFNYEYFSIIQRVFAYLSFKIIMCLHAKIEKRKSSQDHNYIEKFSLSNYHI